jgi:glyoxylase-like metal-dependent hydrolase (beta-lactamase superfamily II)
VIVDEHIAIVGDTLFGVLPNSVYPPFRDCHEELVKSWGKLLETGCALFLPGHGRPIIRKLLEKKYREISTWSSATMEL